jgi:hypothetical protein
MEDSDDVTAILNTPSSILFAKGPGVRRGQERHVMQHDPSRSGGAEVAARE